MSEMGIIKQITHKYENKSRHIKIAALFSFALIMELSSYAGGYFKGKSIMEREYDLNIVRFHWGIPGNSKDTERIQMILGIASAKTTSVKIGDTFQIVMEKYDSAGKSLGDLTVNVPADQLIKSNKGASVGGNETWYYYDFPTNRSVNKMALVSVVLNKQEELKFFTKFNINNTISKQLMQLPKMKSDIKGSTCDGSKWLPPPSTEKEEPKKQAP